MSVKPASRISLTLSFTLLYLRICSGTYYTQQHLVEAEQMKKPCSLHLAGI